MFEQQILAGNFYTQLIGQRVLKKTAVVVLTHILPERPLFIDAIAQLARVALVIPKPKSVNHEALETISATYPVRQLDRTLLADPERAAALLSDFVQPDEKLILMDIGGYFSSCLSGLVQQFGNRLLGCIEVTENGHQRYANETSLPVPVYSVARSPLKSAEDYQIGRSVVFSSDWLMRERGRLLDGLNLAVFGYGKIGRSIAEDLWSRQCATRIVEIDPLRGVEAVSRGYRLHTKEQALQTSDVLFCATGSKVLCPKDFPSIRQGAWLVSVTSADDEFDFTVWPEDYQREKIHPRLERISSDTGHYFYLVNQGNAVNFINGAVVGNLVFLVQAELLEAACALATHDPAKPGLTELPTAKMNHIAKFWLDTFH